MTYIKILLVVFFGVLTILSYLRVKNRGPFFKGITIGFLVYYTLVPIIALIVSKDLIYRYLVTITDSDLPTFLFVLILQFVFYFLFALSYGSGGGVDTNARTRNPKMDTILSFVGNVTLIIGGACTLIYTLSFGGFKEAFALSGTVRSHIDSAIKHIGYWQGILIEPAGLVTIAPFCFLLANRKKNFIDIIKTLVAIFLSVVFYLVKAGRAPLIIFIIAIIFPFLKKKLKHPWILLLIGAIIALPALDIMDTIFDGKSIDSVSYNYLSYINQFAYPFANSLNIFDIISKYGIRYGQDFVTSFLGLIPGVSFDSTWEITSEYYNGPNWAVYGSVPMDVFSFSIIQFHVLGVLIGFVLGFIGRTIDNSLACFDRKKYGTISMETAIFLSTAWRVSTADFQSLIRSIFLIGLCVVVIIITRKRRGEGYGKRLYYFGESTQIRTRIIE